MAASVSLSNLGKNAFIFSAGDLAKQANGSVCASFGDTVVLATACMAKETSEGEDFLPFMVEYQEKTYAMGKIPGGYIKKEGRPKDEEILTARLIDRPLRPLFPKGLTNEVQVIAVVLSSDGANDPDVLAVNAASCALFISDIPFDRPVGAVRVSKTGNNFIINPTYEQRKESTMDLVVVGTESKVVMLEGGFIESKEKEVLEAIKFAQPFIKELINLQLQLREKVGKKKKEMNFCETDKDLLSKVSGKVSEKFENIYGLVCKEERECACDEILSSLVAELKTENAELSEEAIKKAFYDLEAEFVRKKILKEEKRPDGRGLSDIRPLECKVGVLPRTHGSAIFTRGQTQSLAVVTLGTSSDEQFIEALEGETSKHFMLHYSFPPFSVGEVKMVRGPSRRDIGHGALAEKALFAVIPTKEVFPYTIRVVSEILESNGSSSMASACAASLSLMDAGVPIREPVGGIAIGLVTDADSYKILTDIAGVEDHYGDMDFKVTGTKNGITAIQLDIKIEGITFPIIEEVLRAAKEARTVILNKMQEAIALPRQSLSEYAPKIKLFEVPADKIGVIIGPGGKTIKAIQRQNNVTINIDDATSVVSVAAETDEGLQRAVNQINNLIREVEVGDIYDAKVEKIVNFGAFCEIAPGKSGLLHVSEISDEFVKDVAEFLKEGDVIRVKVIGIDPQGKIRLSLKQAK
jgi:polyribonucleotide nucleotidyltransferase